MTNDARLALFAVAMASACSWEGDYCEGDWAAAPEEQAPSMERRVVAQVLPAESSAVDILFVIDDSMSMMDEQEQLGIWSSELFNVLSIAGELPDLHIAVTASSLPIAGSTQCTSGGGLHVGRAVLSQGQFIRDVAGTAGRVRNYSGTLAETFAQMARVGANGCGYEQPFEAARKALATKDFLREDALLLVVFVTDEDDCSASSTTLFSDPYADACTVLGTPTSYRCFEHGVRCYDGKGSREFGERRNCRPDESSLYVQSVSGFADFLKSRKQNHAQVLVAGIYGKPNKVTAIPDERVEGYATPRLANVCGATGEEGDGATPGIRMNALMAAFGGRASHSSICERELSWAMRNMGLITRAAATRSHCLHGALIDTDAAASGIQPSCRVVAKGIEGLLPTTSEVPPCEGAETTRCFTVDFDAGCAETELAFQIRGGVGDETLTVSCDVTVDEVAHDANDLTRAIE